MKKKPYKYLALYHNWMESGRCPYLCNYFIDGDELFELIKPSFDEKIRDSGDGWGTHAWGSHNTDPEISGYGTFFNPFRQTIILFLAAQNGEL